MAEQKFPEPTCAALIFNTGGKLFLMKSHKWRGKYVLPGGHIELGERMEDALKREIIEETGLDVSNIAFIRFFEFIYDDAFWKNAHFICFNFACKTNSDNVQLNSEAEDFVWVSIEDALKLPVEPYSRGTIEEFIRKFPNGF